MNTLPNIIIPFNWIFSRTSIRSGKVFLLFLVLTTFTSTNIFGQESQNNSPETEKVVKVGVLAYRGEDKCFEQWSPTASYLSEQIPGFTFKIVPLTNDNIAGTVDNAEIDFLTTNAGSYVYLEKTYGITRIATSIRKVGNEYSDVFGAIIFTKAERTDINNLEDLVGKSFMAVHQNAFGGWQMAWFEFQKRKVDPYIDFSKLEFYGFPQDSIVFRVLNNNVDAATVRAGVIEDLANRGLIRLDDIKILNPVINNNYPFLLSTELYPEWPMARLRHTDELLAEKVLIALLNMSPEDSSTNFLSSNYRWFVPLDYGPVHDLFRSLKISPYENYGEISARALLKLYWYWFLAALLAGLGLVIVVITISRLNTRLSEARTLLEAKVEERTAKLNQVNVDLLTEIEGRKQAEIAFSEANTIINRSPVVAFLWKNEEGWPIEFVSKNVEKLSGYSEHEFLDRKISYVDIIHKDDLEKVAEEVNRYSKKEGLKTFAHKPYRIITKNGDIKWIDDKTFIRRDSQGLITHYEGIVYDITERKHVENVLKQTHGRLTNTLESMTDGFVSLDKNWIYTYVNQKAGEMFGRKPSDLVGKHIWTEFPEGIDQPFYKNYYKAIETQKPIIFEDYYPPWDSWFENRVIPSSDGLAIFFQNITERKQAVEQLRKNEARLKTLVGTIPDLVWMKDPQGVYLTCNRRFESLVGMPSSEIIGKTDYEFFDRELANFFRQKDNDAAVAGIPSINEEELVFADDGHIEMVETIKTPIFDTEGQITGVLGIARNITERKNAEEKIERFSRIFEESLNEIYLFDSDTLKFTQMNNAAQKNLGYTMEELKKMTPLEIKPEFTLESFEKLIMPLRKGKTREIVFETVHQRKDKSLYDVEVHMQILKYDHTSLFAAIILDITKRKQAEAELLIEKEFSEKIIETSDAVIVGLDKNHLIRIFNKGVESITGYKKAEVIGKDWFNIFFPAEISDDMNKVWKDAWGTSAHSYVNQILTKKGEERIISWQTTGMYEDKDSTKHLLISIGEDITERKLIEDTLHDTQVFNQTLLDTSPDLIYVYDIIDRKNIYSNQGIMKILGYSVEEIQKMGENILPGLMHPDDFDNYLNEIIPRYQTVKDGEIIEHEYRMKHKDGTWKWLLSKESIFARLDDGKPKRIFGLTADITKRIEASKIIQKSEMELKEAQRIGHLGSWYLNLENDEVVWTEELYQMYNFDSTKPPPPYIEHQKLFTAESWNRLSKAIPKTSETGIPYELELETIRKDGSNGWMWVRGEQVKDEKGAIVGLRGVAQDITERKRIEDELLSSENLLNITQRLTKVGGWKWNVENQSMSWTDEMYRIHEIDPTEIEPGSIEHIKLGAKCYDEKDRPTIMNAFQKCADKGISYDLEFPFTTVKGNRIWIRTTAQPEKENGKVVAVIGNIIDITERKFATEKVLKQTRINEQILNTTLDGYILADADGKIINVNPSYCKLVGYSQKELQKMNIRDVEVKIPPEEVDRRIKQMVSKGADRFESQHKHKDGRILAIDTNISIMQIDEKPFVAAFVRDITERKEIMNALEESEEQFKVLFEYAAVPIWLEDFSALKKRFDQLKDEGIQNFEEYFEKHPDEVSRMAVLVKVIGVNQKSVEFYKAKDKASLIKDLPSYFSEESLPVFRQELVALAHGNDSFEGEIPIITPLGEQLHLVINLSVPDKYMNTLELVLVSFVDITERKLAETEIKKQTKELKSLNKLSHKISRTLSLEKIIEIAVDQLLENLQPDLVYFFMRDGDNLILKNVGPQSEWSRLGDIPVHKVGECMCGLAVSGKKPLYSKDIFTDIRCTWDECKEAGFKSFAALPMIVGEEVLGIIGLASNDSRDYEQQSIFLETLINEISLNVYNAMLYEKVIRHADELEIKVDDRTKELSQANIRLQELDKLKSMFIASMSHELRTPLNSIIGFTGLILQGISGKIDEEGRKDLDIVYNSSQHLLSLINDVIDISKIEADKLDIYFEDVKLDDVIEEIVATVSNDAQKKKLKIKTEFPEGLTIVSDRRRLLQCILNLMSNAVKFTEKGTIKLKAAKTADIFKIIVTDTGVGIKKGDIPKLFKSFIRLDTPMREVTAGTGLGLYLTQKIMTNVFRGEISVESDYGKGSTFTLEIPLNIEV